MSEDEEGRMLAFIAVLDASVLFPMSLRDALLRAAEAGLYEARWSDEILEEVRRNLIAKRPMSEAKAQRSIDVMRAHFSNALVADYEGFIPLMTNDPKDRHVLAAAVASEAKVIVTSNLRHFPKTALTPFKIEAQVPDDFLIRLFNMNPERMAQVIREQASDLVSPPKTIPELLGTLAQHAPGFVALMREHLNL